MKRIGSFNAGSLYDALVLAENIKPLLVIAIGKPDEEVILTDAKDGNTAYSRDEDDRHYVPKRTLTDMII